VVSVGPPEPEGWGSGVSIGLTRRARPDRPGKSKGLGPPASPAGSGGRRARSKAPA